MNTHAYKTQENKSQSVANEIAQKQCVGESTFQFIDNRPEAIVQRKLQDMANNSPQNRQLKAFQEMVNNSPRTKEPAQFQKMANEHAAKQQHPIQKKSNNIGLPDNLKAGIENLSGFSMDDVKVYYNSDKPAQLHAHAYTQGTDIYLGPGQKKHLPHEAWHVVQQKQKRVQSTLQLKGLKINNSSLLEKEAEMMGRKSLQGDINVKPPHESDKKVHLSNEKMPIQGVFIYQPGRGINNKESLSDEDMLGKGGMVQIHGVWVHQYFLETDPDAISMIEQFAIAGPHERARYVRITRVKNLKGPGQIAEIQDFFNQHALIQQYVQYWAERGRTIMSSITICKSHEEFQSRYMYYSQKTEVDADVKNISGFHIPAERKIFLAPDKLGRVQFTTLIHESLHLYAENNIRNELGKAINEGMTEFLARRLLADADIDAFSIGAYSSEIGVIQALVDIIGIDLLVNAYFDGTFGYARDAVKRHFRDEDDSRWDAWVMAMKEKDFSEAHRLLNSKVESMFNVDYSGLASEPWFEEVVGKN